MSLTWSLQALLVRHEAYMADAVADRLNLTAQIERLEGEKKELEASNARIIEENKGLTEQLEGLNAAVIESDAQIKTLTESLEESQQKLQKLSRLAARAERLEIQVTTFDQGQAEMQQRLALAEEDGRTAVQRWKQAERTLLSLHDQIERIETEAREERERHEEIIERMERRRAVEQELVDAAGRLKNKAVVTAVERDHGGGNAVSHFVKDILQDNANLQLGIVELREMLINSNEEITNLREQLLLHQPELPNGGAQRRSGNLLEELGSEAPRSLSQELHVHHHYHAASRMPDTSRQRSVHRKPKSKRTPTNPASHTSPSSARNARAYTFKSIRPSPPSTAAAILSHTSVSIPPAPPAPHRWSVQSAQSRSSIAASSVPSSPQSMLHSSSIFERAFNDNAADSSRPTSPESNGVMSPGFLPLHKKRNSDASFRSFSTPAMSHFRRPSSALLPGDLPPAVDEADFLETAGPVGLAISDCGHSTIAEEEDLEGGDACGKGDGSTSRETLRTKGNDIDEMHEVTLNHDDMMGNPLSPSDDLALPKSHRPLLRRAASHESLLSLSTAVDIPAGQRRGSQSIATSYGFPSSLSFGISSPSAALASSRPVLSSMTATARPTMPQRGYNSSMYNRTLLSGSYRDTVGKRSVSAEQVPRAPLGKRLGGWVWGKWGTNAPSSENNRTPNPHASRATGVNQPGRIIGLAPPAASKGAGAIVTSELDEDLLKETLAEIT
ncbi:hypothetical protein L228DRAFT_92491 [Xylona heveae TC161]|uniref:Uncharacterized protein n=1 Tax=Xylona heveae (strain CBS 132557 / TC161) TaxID=1328760 RepID=A0A165I227_XYLHT|nr:hypothetical protein L228DRAFT_92491 [Xylona heveae TC161]KZF24251.1 hypothetical protein L228DRAFT_92491 [Xylona heveae TC161]